VANSFFDVLELEEQLQDGQKKINFVVLPFPINLIKLY
jgi:hypothetical protein